MSTKLAFGALAAFLVSCGSTPPPPPEPVDVVVPEPPELDVGPIGDDAALTVFFWPSRWADATRAARDVFGPVLPRDLRQILEEPTFTAGLTRLAREMGVGFHGLEGLDFERPIVVGLGEPSPGGLSAALDRIGGPTSADMTHRVVLPASNPAQLERAVEATLRSVECEPGEDYFRCPGAGVAVHRTAGEIVVVIAAVPEAMVPASITEEPTGRPTLTPALRFAASGDSVLSAYARPGAARELHATMALSMVGLALGEMVPDPSSGWVQTGSVSPEYRAPMLAAGLSETLGGYVRMSPAGAEIDDLALGVVLEPGPSLVAVAGLTEHGQQVVAAGHEGDGAARSPGGSAPLSIRTPLDIAAMTDRAGIPLGFVGRTDPDDIAQPIEECGFVCYLHLPLTRPMSMIGLLEPLFDEIASEMGHPLARLERAALPPGRLGEVEVDVEHIATEVRPGSDVVEALREAAPIRGRIDLVDRTLVASLTIRGNEPPAIEPGNDPGPVGPASRRTEATHCLTTLGLTVTNALSAYASVQPEDRQRVWEELRAHTEAPAACARGDGATRDEAEAYLSVIERFDAELQDAPTTTP